AVEVQLPFLQNVLPPFRFLPIVMGDQRKEYCVHLGKKLARILAGKHSLLIASTDLSHYHTYQQAKNLDHVFIHDVEIFDCEQLINHLDNETTEACGGGAAVAIMTAAKLLGANRIQTLNHCNSGDITGDHKRVVGYLSAAIVRTN
ncbi:MAG TPA: AmmeMemoRadiSam system protein B, partial [Bacteroidota bacterium]|nr:AmmeMemoRadiSam system protein B [Bacteroidota bacterium]